MTVSTDDLQLPNSTFQTPQEYVVCILLILLHFAADATVIQLFRGKLLEISSVTWRFSMGFIAAFWFRHTLIFFVLYLDCPKIVSLLAAIFAAINAVLLVCGLAHILKEGFCKNSKILTPERITIFQIFVVVLHFILIGPYYYLIFAYPVSKAPFSIKPFQTMYIFHIILAYVYVVWQYFYMAYYLKAFFEQMGSLNHDTGKRPNALRDSMRLIIAALITAGVGIVVWMASYAMTGLNGQLAFYLGQAMAMFMCVFSKFVINQAVLFFAELRHTTKKVAKSSGNNSGGKSGANNSSSTFVKKA